MQRLNKSAHAPMGTAFFLFLCLAIVPVSLKALGVQVGISPRLSAAIDAWHQIAEVVGSNSQAGSETSALNNSGNEPSRVADEITCPRELAYVDALEQMPRPSQDVIEGSTTRAVSTQVGCPKAASRTSTETKRVEPKVVSAATDMSFGKRGRAIEVFSATTLESVANNEVLRHIDKQVLRRGFERSRMLPIPEDLKVLIRMKPSIAPSTIKGAQGKVRTAFASERRRERERASLTMLPTTPENCEF